VSGGDLYVGGDFTQSAGGATSGLNRIARYDTGAGTWHALADNGLNSLVTALAVSGGNLYVGGLFIQSAGGATTGLGRIAAYGLPGPDVTSTAGTTAAAQMPETGFAPGVVTQLPAQPAERAYASTDLVLAIPKLGLETAIVGVPQSADGWDVTWLGQQAGYLYGTAFPTWAGNTVITAHVWDANNNPGPFANLADLQHGDRIEIAAAFGQTYIYEVRASASLRPTDTRAFASSDYDILTLITCEGFDARTGDYRFRRVVTAVLVEIR
jgi:LPXTG-site transpeptidase (sortase) family protein